jgi:hypothetical protein
VGYGTALIETVKNTRGKEKSGTTLKIRQGIECSNILKYCSVTLADYRAAEKETGVKYREVYEADTLGHWKLEKKETKTQQQKNSGYALSALPSCMFLVVAVCLTGVYDCVSFSMRYLNYTSTSHEA